ncbi:MAG: glycosyltransferase [Cyanobacteriota bacterium]|nr:glycosyltransferase [Cyanobacteriota bacterium]
MVFISVIIPAYNAENTIEETIQSVLNQTFKDFEIIVINDGSQDKTLEKLASIQDNRIQVYSYQNSGQSISRNRGFQQSKGEFIAFLDADDLWTPDKLEAQLTAIKENSNAAIAYSWTNYIDENSNIIRKGSQLNITGNVYPNLLIANFLENGSNPLIQRKALMEVGEFDKDLTPAEDWDLYLRLAARYPFIVVPKAQILYRVYSNSMSSNTLKMEKSTLEVINRAFQQAPQSLQYLKKQSLANVYKYLTFKALEQQSSQQTDVTRFFKNAIQYDPSLLTKRVTLKILSQIAAKNLLSPAQTEKLSQRYPQFFNPVTLLGYMEIHPK